MNRIKELREARGIDQKVLAIDLRVSQPTISGWETGIKQPSFKSAARLADYFGVSMDYLLGRDLKRKGIKIPVLGHVAAGIPIEAIEDIIDYEEVTEEMAACGDYFALQIKGNSMEPRIKEGDVVIVRQQPDIESGEVAVVVLNGCDATVKKVVKHEDGLSLIPFNAAYTPKFYTCKEAQEMPIIIIGKVVELRGKF